MSLAEILENQHFNQFAAILAVTMAPGWRMRHPEVKSIRAALERLAKLAKGFPDLRQTFVEEWWSMMSELVMADVKLLHYSEEDAKWFYEVVYSDDARVTMSMMFAVASSRQDWFTAEQLGESTSDAASTWRNRAANDEIVGARKAGKTWIFNGLALRAYGVPVPSPMNVEVEVVDKESEE